MNHQSLYENNPVARALEGKWGRMLEGITNPKVRQNTAILLETQYQKPAVITEDTASGANATSGGFDFSAGNGTGANNDISPFQHYLLPLVRRVYPNLIANELVGVQPMTSPASLVFYLKYKYTGLVNPDKVSGSNVVQGVTNKGSTVAGTEYGNFVGNTWNIDPYYSLQTVFRESLVSSPVTTGNGTGASPLAFVASPNATPVIPGTLVIRDGTVVVSVAETGTPANTATITYTVTAGVLASGTGVVTSTGGAAITALASTATLVDGVLSVAVTSTPGVGVTASTSTATRTYDYNMEGNRTMPEMELNVESFPVSAKTRKLRTKWTIEAAQDLRAMHNLDAEQELISVLANEVTAEIDREIINDLIVNAAIAVDYDYSNPFLVGGIVGTNAAGQIAGWSSGTSPAGFAPQSGFVSVPGSTTFEDRNKALFYQILEVSNQIYRQSLRGAGNWIVTSPEIAAKLESLLEFKPDARTDTTYNLGITYSGTLNGQFKVYKDPLFSPTMILVGYKGDSFMDAGFFYCPYVPLQLTPTVLDTESFNPRKGLITRYGKVMVENGGRMYGRIRVSNLSATGASQLPGADQRLAGSTVAQQNTADLSATIASTDLI